MNPDPEHRRRSIRLQGYDYSLPGAYFVTIVTSKRACYFGRVQDNEMFLNDIGLAIQSHWLALPDHTPFLRLGEFILMPNHLHAILWIYQNLSITQADPQNQGLRLPMPASGTIPGSLGAVLQNFKSVSARFTKAGFGISGLWQHGYYDRVIRNERELAAIREYILTNPANWQKDQEYR